MANPQPTDAHLRIAHSLTEEIMMRNFTKRQRCILDLILRLSWGCNKKHAVIPKLKYFELCGISKSKIREELKYLANAKVIIWEEAINTFAFNKNYNEWKISIVKGYDKEILSELIHLNLKSNNENPIHNSVDNHVDNTVDSDVDKNIEDKNEVPEMGTKLTKREQSSHPKWGTKLTKRELSNPPTQVTAMDVVVPKESIKESIKEIDDDEDKGQEKSISKISTLYQNNIGGINYIIAEKLINISEEYNYELVEEAFKIASYNHAKNIRYIETILMNWKDKNINTLEDLAAYEKEKENSKSFKNGNSTSSKQGGKNNVKQFKTKFHLEKSRGDKYTADELEKMVLNNQKKKLDEVKNNSQRLSIQ